jgi:hypothetical protein
MRLTLGIHSHSNLPDTVLHQLQACCKFMVDAAALKVQACLSCTRVLICT